LAEYSGAIQMTIRRLFILILLTQTGCIAVGLAFHHLYVSSGIARAEAEEARARLANQFLTLEPELERQSVSSLQPSGEAWQRLLARWRTTAKPADRLFLLDREGRVVAAADEKVKPRSANDFGQPLTLIHPSAAWGQFDGPIQGLLQNPASGEQQIALGRGLSAHDGYLLITRTAGDEKVDLAALKTTLASAGVITLFWTAGLLAVTLYMTMVRSRREPAAGQPKLDVEALKQAQALVRTQETVIFGLAKLSDSRDPETGTHLERISQFSSMLAAGLRQRPEFRERITPGFVQLIGISSALHDIGKVGVEDSILRKPGTLTLDERTRMQCHTQIGAECLKEIERRLGSTNFLQMAREIVSAHHEWWNGQGYPLGLAGEQIPLSARIVAVADVYDALRSKRVYKDALPHDECVRLIAGAAGTQFDPRLVEVFLQMEDRFRQLADQLQTLEQPFPSIESSNSNFPSHRGEEHVSIS
jgi:HD-GYP domain-containing protein (c-di-GMP phosphodiesterase class II)